MFGVANLKDERNEGEHPMNTKDFAKTGIAFALLLAPGAVARAQTQAPAATDATARQTATEGSKFYCNISALDPAERAHHQQLTAKLIAVRNEIVELPRGYEFQFSPSTMSIAELADWVVAEGKCCPFFNFHIDLEKKGNLLCLGLTGEEGIKALIRTEFHVPAK
jgi:hypothetical protein